MIKSLLLIFFLIFSSRIIFAGNWHNRGGLVDTASKSSGKNWQKLGKTKADSIDQLLEIIKSSEYGKVVIAKAQAKAKLEGFPLNKIVDVGDSSITDTTLIRKFSATDPFSITYKSESRIFLDKSLDVKNAVLDLVHELTHYAYKEDFNPYKENFSIESFVKDTIEGTGGEVDAFLVECKVSRSIFGESGHSAQCKSIIDANGDFSKEMAITEFYKIGNYFHKFEEKVMAQGFALDHFPKISKENGLLVSSAWSRPYPVAAAEEYNAIMSRVCENDTKRMAVIGDSIDRSPASEKFSFTQAKLKIATRCAEFSKN